MSDKNAPSSNVAAYVQAAREGKVADLTNLLNPEVIEYLNKNAAVASELSQATGLTDKDIIDPTALDKAAKERQAAQQEAAQQAQREAAKQEKENKDPAAAKVAASKEGKEASQGLKDSGAKEIEEGKPVVGPQTAALAEQANNKAGLSR